MIATLKEKAYALVERNLTKQATVLQTRHWASGNLTEIDLHLPAADMSGWKQVQHIKMQVAPGCYRDYTPSGWDEETRTCTLFISTRHDGKGSLWARNLQPGYTIRYLGIAGTPHRLTGNRLAICFGDMSALGHFMALRQLADGRQLLCGAITGMLQQDGEEFARLREPFDLLSSNAGKSEHAFLAWLDRNPTIVDDVMFYIAGQSSMVAGLRKALRQRGHASVKAQGFWS